ncbi:uncharacterized protein LOC100120638 isoform X2 [Nasonia vitripennis]|nr:uncharacterized protein LOC100120638 isoform X2 [Nasonia vitripennis]XP_031781344.1 uncharacterized protein LOC100120638 isoform X2 [Nasonia vitripennis]
MEEARTPGGASPAATVAAVLENAPDTPVEAPIEGVARGESSPETGSQPASGARDGGSSAAVAGSEPVLDRLSRSHKPVGRDAPNIPNVVEYHLKVKPQQVRRDQPQQQLADTETAALVAAGLDMKKDRQQAQTLTEEQRRELTLRLSKLSVDSNVFEGSSDLPQVFQVKYLGSHDARGLWGIKHTRKPVDNMVAAAKSLPSGTFLPFIKLVISEDGVGLLPIGKKRGDSISRIYPIESISYGVQDLVYTRVFSMIVVRETEDFRRMSPFECHGFVCESKHHARQMTYALAAAFQIYSQHVKGRSIDPAKSWSKGFAIELRNPNELEADYTLHPED